MNEKATAPPSSGMTLADVYYVLFRHKWKILLVSGAGLLAAVGFFFLWPVTYGSEAKLFIRYVQDAKSPGQVGTADPKVKSPDERGENIINSELEVLTSLDLALEVATNVGPEQILAKAGGGADPNKAAGLIHAGLLVEVPKKSDVIRIVLQHPDRQLVQTLLSKLIDTYFKRHAEVHRAAGVFDDFLQQETDQLKSRLLQTEDELRTTKARAGVTSLEDTKKVYTEQLSKVRQDFYNAEAELAERQAAVAEMTKLLHPEAQTVAAINTATGHTASTSTNSMGATNGMDAANIIAPPSDKVVEYKRLCALLDTLEKRHEALLVDYRPESSMVKGIEEQIAATDKLKKQLEDENPGLIAVKLSETRATDLASTRRIDLVAEMARVAALEAKVKTLTNQLDKIRKEATVVDVMEGSITELQRKKELEEGHYKYFMASLEQSRIDRDLGAGRVSNISRIQAPSPPFLDVSVLVKAVALSLVGSLAAGIALAFLIELYLDRSLRRPAEIETQLGLSLFASIPMRSRNGKFDLLKAGKRNPLLARKNNGTKSENPNAETAEECSSAIDPERSEHQQPVTSRHPAHGKDVPIRNRDVPDLASALRPFYEALRNRLHSHFEVKNQSHTPKLVALTSCAEGCGVTTTAAGLALCMSETGDGKVLLVDMNLQEGQSHPAHGKDGVPCVPDQFHNGNYSCGLDDFLENGMRTLPMVQDNLYVVKGATNGEKPPGLLPKRFIQRVPELKASDYDYIIFDMPPVSQISVTPSLARFMDMVLVVVESEKTDRDVLKRAMSLLGGSKANVGVILNKGRTYVPHRLQQEL